MHKYKIGDQVYFLENNKISNNIIDGIITTEISFNYRFSFENKHEPIDFMWKTEEDCFKTKQELIESL